MNPRFKFHAIAITMIIIIVSGLYTVMGPKKAPQGVVNTSGKAIAIDSATWGEQCNTAITEALNTRGQTALAKDESGNAIPPAPLKLIEPNNVLTAVGTLCNGKTACEFRVNSESLGIDPMANCFKRLVVAYRCFSFDRLTTLDLGQGENLSIDCLKQHATDAAASPKAQ